MKKFKNIQMTHLLWIGVVFLLPLAGACQKEELHNEAKTIEDAYQAIVGEWEWKETIVSHRGQENPTYETPITENKTIQYVFRENSTAVKIENGKDFIDYKFEITSMEAGGFHLTLSPIDETLQVSNTFLIFYNENLILTNRLGISSYYIQKKPK